MSDTKHCDYCGKQMKSTGGVRVFDWLGYPNSFDFCSWACLAHWMIVKGKR